MRNQGKPCWGWAIASAWIAAGALLLGCGGAGKARNEKPENGPRSPIEVAQVALESVQNEVEVPAKVAADPERVVHIFPPVSGRLVSLAVHPGDLVEAGQTVATIESSDAAAARADYDKARIESRRLEGAERRASLLLAHEAMAQKDYEDIKAQAESARSDLTRTEQRLRMLGLNGASASDRVAIRSPRSGVVVEIGAANGELSKSLDNASSIATIADLRSVWVVGDLYEKDLALAPRGTPARITFAGLPGESARGTIANVSDVLDPASRTLKIRVVVPNQGRRLKPEMFAAIHLSGPKRQLMTVPATAVLHEGEAAFVMVKKADGSFEKRSVSIASSESGKTQIASGLKAGETIVVAGAELLRNEGAGS